MYVAANDRYVVVNKDGGPSAQITLIDVQTTRRQALSPPDCPALDNEGPPVLGGPWLMVSCGPDAYQLYNLASGQWVSFSPSPQCGYSPRLGKAGCQPVGVGSRWVKLETTDGTCSEHCLVIYDLQNILTGALQPDPITAGGVLFDDLNSPSGSASLCPPLRYPRSYDGDIPRGYQGRLASTGRSLWSGALCRPEGER